VLNSVDGRGIKNVPVMEFTREGQEAMRPNKLVMLGGNHRREALQIYINLLKTQLETEEKALQTKEGDIGGDVDKLRERVKVLRGEIEQYQFWAVRIYDVGEFMIE
jgi:hypothetical protein